MAITVRQASPADVDVVVAILMEAAEWLSARGTPMWRNDELLVPAITGDVARGLFFLGEDAAEPVGTVRFQLSDPEFWPDVPEGESAFIHRLAIRRHAAGGGVSSALMGWARERATTLGLRYLRLDCDASRFRLRSVYERFGFNHHSDRQVGPYFVARYQLRLSPSMVPEGHRPTTASS
jgi:GNAT superfamily N-acetyltransferase